MPVITGEQLTKVAVRQELAASVRRLRRDLRKSGIRTPRDAERAWKRIQLALIASYGIRFWQRGLRTSSEMVLNAHIKESNGDPDRKPITKVVELLGSRVIFSLCGIADACADVIRGPDVAEGYLNLIDRATLRKKLKAAEERAAHRIPRRIRRQPGEAERLISLAESRLRKEGVQKHEINKRIAKELNLSVTYVAELRRKPKPAGEKQG